MRSGFAATTAAIALCCLGLALPAAAQGVGAIGGVVADSSDAALPGVTVVLSNPGVIGGTQETVADGRGAYQFTRLVPSASYTVSASLTGFRTSVQNGIVVNADGTARVDFHLEIGTLSETIVVSGQAPLLDTSTTMKQTVMTRETIDVLPARNNVWSIARSVPAVTMNKIDVGGSEMFAQSAARVHGASVNEGAYQIDGMDVGYAGSEGGLMTYFDANTFQELNVQTSGASAESSKGGIVQNMITRTGTNKLSGDYRFTGASHGMGSKNVSPLLRADLLAAVPARTLAANPNIQPGAEILGIYDHTVTLSGPIVHDRLWYTATGSSTSLNQYRLGSYNPDGTKVLDDNRMLNGQGKISWQVRPGSQLHFMFNYNNKHVLHYSGNVSTTFVESAATVNQTIKSPLYQARWTSVVSRQRQMLLDISTSILDSHETDMPQNGLPASVVAGFDQALTQIQGAAPVYYYRQGARSTFQSSLSLRAGSHDMKLGYQYQYRHNGDDDFAVGPYAPAGIRAVFSNGVPIAANTYNDPLKFDLFSRDHAVYFQDRWQPAKKLTFNLGVRLENTSGRLPVQCQVQNIFIEGRCFPAVQDLPNFVGLSPRFSVIYDVSGDGKTALKFTANRYDTPSGNTLNALVNPIRLSNDTRTWSDGNGDRIPQLNELGPSTGFNIGTTNRFSPDLTWPFALEYSVGLERQLPGNIVVGVTYINRRRQNELGTRNLAVPANSYTPLQVTEAKSGRLVTVYNQDPSLSGKFDVLFDNQPALNTDFNGVDVTFNKRLSGRWMLMGGLTFGRNVGDVYGSAGDFNNPNFQFRRGVIEDDMPLMFKTAGLYQAPYGISVSGSVQHFTGYPELTTVLVAADSVRLTQVSQSITVQPRGTTRLPATNIMDLSARRTFRAGRYAVEPVLDVFNVTNTAAIRARVAQLGPGYGRASDIVRGRLVKIGLNLMF